MNTILKTINLNKETLESQQQTITNKTDCYYRKEKKKQFEFDSYVPFVNRGRRSAPATRLRSGYQMTNARQRVVRLFTSSFARSSSRNGTQQPV